MSWFAVSHWQRHGYWSQLARMRVPSTARSPVSPRWTPTLSEVPRIARATPTRARASCERALTLVASGSGSTTAPPLSSSASPRRPRSVLFSNRALLTPRARSSDELGAFRPRPRATTIPSSTDPEAQRRWGRGDRRLSLPRA